MVIFLCAGIFLEDLLLDVQTELGDYFLTRKFRITSLINGTRTLRVSFYGKSSLLLVVAGDNAPWNTMYSQSMLGLVFDI